MPDEESDLELPHVGCGDWGKIVENYDKNINVILLYILEFIRSNLEENVATLQYQIHQLHVNFLILLYLHHHENNYAPFDISQSMCVI